MCAYGEMRAQVGEKRAMKNAMIRYMLNAATKKTAIKSIDIVKQCLKNEQKWFAQLLPEVEEALNEVSVIFVSFQTYFSHLCSNFRFCFGVQNQAYGLVVHEIKEKSGKFYLITSEFGCESVDECREKQREELRLLFIVLSYIFMKGDEVLEPVLFGFLRKLEIGDEPDAHFGWYQKKITETFVKQHYLTKEKIEMESGNMEER